MGIPQTIILSAAAIAVAFLLRPEPPRYTFQAVESPLGYPSYVVRFDHQSGGIGVCSAVIRSRENPDIFGGTCALLETGRLEVSKTQPD
jgi:hypothetical protein